MTITTIKQITFTNLMKEFKKYISKGKAREVLHNVSFDGENFVATDGCILLQVNKDAVSDIPSEIITGSLINPSTLEVVEIEGKQYPNTSRLIPTDCNLNIRLNGSLDELYGFIKEGNAELKGKSHEKLHNFIMHSDYLETRAIEFKDGQKEMKLQSIMKHRHVLESDNTEYNFHLRSEYITTALMTIRKLSKLSKDDIQFKVRGRMQPIVFEQTIVFKILIMPVRVY